MEAREKRGDRGPGPRGGGVGRVESNSLAGQGVHDRGGLLPRRGRVSVTGKPIGPEGVNEDQGSPASGAGAAMSEEPTPEERTLPEEAARSSPQKMIPPRGLTTAILEASQAAHPQPRARAPVPTMEENANIPTPWRIRE